VVLARTDRDGDGHIEQHEVRTVMQNLGAPMSDDAIKKLIAGVDTDGNGMVRAQRTAPLMPPLTACSWSPGALCSIDALGCGGHIAHWLHGVGRRPVELPGAVPHHPNSTPLTRLVALAAAFVCAWQVEFDEFIGIMGARIVKDNAELEQAVNIFFSAGDDDGEPKGCACAPKHAALRCAPCRSMPRPHATRTALDHVRHVARLRHGCACTPRSLPPPPPTRSMCVMCVVRVVHGACTVSSTSMT
jgi:hypothetical protein